MEQRERQTDRQTKRERKREKGDRPLHTIDTEITPHNHIIYYIHVRMLGTEVAFTLQVTSRMGNSNTRTYM